MPTAKVAKRFFKIPLTYVPEDKRQSFPPFQCPLYLELLENKSKVKLELRDKEYIPTQYSDEKKDEEQKCYIQTEEQKPTEEKNDVGKFVEKERYHPTTDHYYEEKKEELRHEKDSFQEVPIYRHHSHRKSHHRTHSHKEEEHHSKREEREEEHHSKREEREEEHHSKRKDREEEHHSDREEERHRSHKKHNHSRHHLHTKDHHSRKEEEQKRDDSHKTDSSHKERKEEIQDKELNEKMMEEEKKKIELEKELSMKKGQETQPSSVITNSSRPPTLSEIAKTQPQTVMIGNVPVVNISKMSHEEETKKRSELQATLKKLKLKYPGANVPEYSDYADIRDIQRGVDDTTKELELNANIAKYKIILVVGFFMTQFILNYFGLDVDGFVKEQITCIYQYNDLLIELGEQPSYFKDLSYIPVEIRLLGVVVGQGLLFATLKYFSKSLNIDLVSVMKIFSNPNSSVPFSSVASSSDGIFSFLSALTSSVPKTQPNPVPPSQPSASDSSKTNKMKGPKVINFADLKEIVGDTKKQN